MKESLERKKLLAFVTCVFCLPVFVRAQYDSTANVTDIMSRHRESLMWSQAFSMRVNVYSVPLEGIPNKSSYERNFIFRYDANTMRADWTGRFKSGRFTAAAASDADPCRVVAFNKVLEGQYGIETEHEEGTKPLSAMVYENYREQLERLLDNDGYGGPLLGRIYGSGHFNVAELLRQAGDVKVRATQEEINGLQCYVLEGTTRFGAITVWVAPARAYAAAKWVIRKSSIDLFNDKPNGLDVWVAEFEVVEFEQFGTAFVPKRASFTLTSQSPGRPKEIGRRLYEVSEVQLDPDFSALGAFRVVLPEGTRVFMRSAPGLRYVWRDGKVSLDNRGASFEQIDKAIDGLKEQK